MDIIFQVQNKVGLITLNRESHLNALTLEMIKSMHQTLQKWEQNVDIAAVIVKSDVNSKAFCAGGDIRWLYKMGLEQDPIQLDFFRREYKLNYCIANYKKPYIALMNGITMGGGVGISMHGSFPVVTDKFLFAMPETAIGFFPDIGASYFLSRLENNYGIYLGLTGKRLKAFAAKKAGLIRYVINSSQYDECCSALIEKISSNDSEQTQQQIHDILTAFKIEGDEELEDIKLIREVFSYDHMLTILNFLQNSSNQFHRELFENVKTKSPLSLCVTLHQLQLAKNMDLKQCLEMDFCLVQHFIKDKDFYEGVRSLLIDKDNNPLWDPPSLEAVNFTQVLSYFEAKEQLQIQ